MQWGEAGAAVSSPLLEPQQIDRTLPLNLGFKPKNSEAHRKVKKVHKLGSHYFQRRRFCYHGDVLSVLSAKNKRFALGDVSHRRGGEEGNNVAKSKNIGTIFTLLSQGSHQKKISQADRLG